MNQITITLHVDAATAVREGRCLAGPCPVKLTAEDVAALDPYQRDALARHLGDRTPRGGELVRWGDTLTLHADPIAYADASVVAALLTTRALVMARQAAELASGDQSPIAVQRRIVEAVRAADCEEARQLARSVAALGPIRDVAIVLAALVRSPALWDACAQLRQIHVLEERAVHEKHLRPTNPNPEIDR